jgi:hypothetical protein
LIPARVRVQGSYEHERDRRNSSELGLPAALPNSLLPSSLHATRTLGSLAQFVRLENIAVRYTISPPDFTPCFLASHRQPQLPREALPESPAYRLPLSQSEWRA